MAKRNKFGLDLHPEALKKNGRTKFVVLPYEEFVLIQERLEDARDLLDLRRAVSRDRGGPGMSLAELRNRLGPKTTRRRNDGSRSRRRRKA